MPVIQKTTTVTIDDATFDVASMSEAVQQMIGFMDEWRQKEADLTSDLLMVRGAIRDVQNTLVATIKDEREKAAAVEATPEQPDAPVVGA